MDKDKLLANRADTDSGLPEDDVEIPGVGTARVRGLRRGEVFLVQEAKTTAASERKILSLGMLDPQLTEAEAGRWQQSSPAGEIEPVIDRIRELSGLADDATKSGVQAAGGAAGSGVRDVPVAEAVDDGRPSAGGDVER